MTRFSPEMQIMQERIKLMTARGDKDRMEAERLKMAQFLQENSVNPFKSFLLPMVGPISTRPCFIALTHHDILHFRSRLLFLFLFSLPCASFLKGLHTSVCFRHSLFGWRCTSFLCFQDRHCTQPCRRPFFLDFLYWGVDAYFQQNFVCFCLLS